MFSFGCLCHVSFEGITEYAVNIHPKLKQGSNCFWMVADYKKYNSAIANLKNLRIWNALPRSIFLRLHLKFIYRFKRAKLPVYIKPDEDDEPRPGGRWYDAGIDRTCAMLEGQGYRVIDPDVGTSLRDPIIHFVKA